LLLDIYLAAMKKLAAIPVLFICLFAGAQDTAKNAALTYKSYTSFPAFPLFTLDSSKISSVSVLTKHEPVVVICFSPTCSHCQHQAEEITSHMKDFKDVKFLMVSSYPMQEVREFAETYALNRFPNILVASDPNFSMGHFYELRSLPGIYLYDKKGKLKKHFETNVLAEDLLKAIQE